MPRSTVLWTNWTLRTKFKNDEGKYCRAIFKKWRLCKVTLNYKRFYLVVTLLVSDNFNVKDSKHFVWFWTHKVSDWDPVTTSFHGDPEYWHLLLILLFLSSEKKKILFTILQFIWSNWLSLSNCPFLRWRDYESDHSTNQFLGLFLSILRSVINLVKYKLNWGTHNKSISNADFRGQRNYCLWKLNKKCWLKTFCILDILYFRG